MLNYETFGSLFSKIPKKEACFTCEQRRQRSQTEAGHMGMTRDKEIIHIAPRTTLGKGPH